MTNFGPFWEVRMGYPQDLAPWDSMGCTYMAQGAINGDIP